MKPCICSCACERHATPGRSFCRPCQRTCRAGRGVKQPQPLFERYVESVSGCWEWTGAVNRAGYGTVSRSYLRARDGRRKTSPIGAHRLAWMEAYGPIPDGLCVLHRCDNRRCIRPDHLFLGTIADNQADASAKGRLRRTGKLIPAQVIEIRVRFMRGESGRDLGREFGISSHHASAIGRGVFWRRLWREAAA